MSYNNGCEGIMVKSEILGLKDMNPALQGMILKLTTGQCLIQSNFSVSQAKWRERSKELNETTLHMILDNITSYIKSTKDNSSSYGRSYALRILTDNMRFNKSHIDKMVSSDMLPALLSEGLIKIKSLDEEMQKKTIDTLIKEAVESYRGTDRWGRSGLNSHDAIVPGLTMEMYEYLLEKAEEAYKKKFKNQKQAEEFHDGIITGDIKGELLEHEQCPFDILEKHGKPLMSELLLRLRTNQELSIENLPVGSYKEDYNTQKEKIVAYIIDIMDYKTCPLEYIKKIMACKEVKNVSDVETQLLELKREDLVLLQLQLLLDKPEQFRRFFRESYNGRQVFWTRFMQLLNGKPEFLAFMKSTMLDAGTLDLPKPKGDFDD